MKSEIDELIEEAQKEEKYFKNYLKYAKIIKKEARKLLKEVKVLIFGSILKKDEIARDIDILVISPDLKNLEKQSEVREKIFKKIGCFSPFEIHLITPEQYRNWYSHFIEEKVEI
ncbi:MAG: nucleotidyltransferase domain-containing protein [Patescibacteria group bacterium]|nr:nucleotidyltransferase domain-containing protein [Patescibacteria group bacterium]